ncbi:MAG: 3-dehydroquinate synthase [Legionellales bacterium]|nr:3-dehydroquinate synthase [Legionellales bacterium]
MNIQILSKTNDYRVYFGSIFEDYSAFLSSICHSQVLVVTDENVAEIYLGKFKKLLANLEIEHYVLPAGESSKKLSLLDNATSILLEKRYTKKTTIIALGGGMVGDFAGLLAALYFRGVDCIQIPTSLLAMVDSSIGGKTAVNHALGKNILGVIYPPKAVFIDMNFIKTLENKEFLSAMSEVIKYGLLFDKQFFCWLERSTKMILARDSIVLADIVEKCCKFKADIVSIDENESNIRTLLNLGHTLAHALERITNYSYFLHGEAVAIGLVFATKVSCLLGMLSEFDIKRVKNLLQKLNLPVCLGTQVTREDILNSMLSDKKNYQESIRMVLLDGIGCGKICQDLSIDVLRQALDEVYRS